MGGVDVKFLLVEEWRALEIVAEMIRLEKSKLNL